MKLLRSALVVLASLAASSLASAQPTIAADGVRNSASYALPGLPNSSIAQGSIFVVFGTNLGPAKIVQVSSFPLPTSAGLSGTSIQITVNGTSVFAIMLYTLSTQVAAILPSNTPIGTGTLTVTYNGQTSNSAPITVVKSSFGIFAANQAGSGQGVFQNVNSQTDRPFNSPTESAQAGQVIILWGTGLGPVSGDETGGPLPGDMPSLDVHVFVAGVEAKIQYRGRSGCCAGDDQIVFVVPAGVEGCALPVYVVVNGVVSNFVTIAVGANGAACQDPNSFSSALLQLAEKNGGLKIGSLSVGRSISESPNLPKTRSDGVYATFEFYPLAVLTGAQALPVGACTIIQYPVAFGGGATLRPLKAGDVSAATPVGTYPLPLIQPSTGTYGIAFYPGYPNPAPPGIINSGAVLTPGTTTFSWTAGPDIPAGSGSIDFPVTFVFTSDADIVTIDRSQALTLNWTGGTKGGVVNIYISSPVSASTGASLSCAADATLGTFTIAAELLSALSPSFTDASGTPMGNFSITEQWFGTFSSPGIDDGITSFSDSVLKGGITIK